MDRMASLTAEQIRKRRSKFKRKAVVVGINAYPAPNTLNGCKADALDMRDTLAIVGFPPTNIKLLTDERATKQNILDKLEWLVRDAKAGDVLVFYYSGHGTQMTDEDNDEADHIDEAIVPVDFNESGMIIDDRLGMIFDKLPAGVRCDVVLDSCFSGTATRLLQVEGIGMIPTPAYKKSRFMPPPIEQRVRINSMIPSRTDKTRFGTAALVTPSQRKAKEMDAVPGQHNALWSACQPNQVSWELDIDGAVRGAYTYTFCKILRRSNGNINRQDIFQIARTTMSNEGYEQIPDLEVPTEEALLQYPFRRIFEDDPTEIKAEPGQ